MSLQIRSNDSDGKFAPPLQVNHRPEISTGALAAMYNISPDEELDAIRERVEIARTALASLVNSRTGASSRAFVAQKMAYEELRRELTVCVSAIQSFKVNFSAEPDASLVNEIQLMQQAGLRHHAGILALEQLYALPHFHPNCGHDRAERLLRDKDMGTFLLRPGYCPDLVCLSYRTNADGVRGRVGHIALQVSADGKLHVLGTPTTPEQQIFQRTGGMYIQPLADAPLDHQRAQFEYNLTHGDPKELLRRNGIGATCLTRGVTKDTYVLHVARPAKRAVREVRANGKRLRLSGDESEPAMWVEHIGVRLTKDGIQADAIGASYQASSLYQLYSSRIPGVTTLVREREEASCLEELHYQTVLPLLLSAGRKWGKVSRKAFPFLGRSCIVNTNGEFYAYAHKKSKTLKGGLVLDGSEDKSRIGRGSYKTVWKLLPFYKSGSATPFVRARFYSDNERLMDQEIRLNAYERVVHLNKYHQTLRSSVSSLEALRSELGSDPNLIIPETVIFPRKGAHGGTVAVMQLMPEMEGDLRELAESLTYKGQLRAAIGLSKGLMALHVRGWRHLDLKTENVLVSTKGHADKPEVKLADFDFCKKVLPGEALHLGTPVFCDPLMMQKRCIGPTAGAVADQFSYGVVLYELFCGEELPRTDEEIIKGVPITEQMLERGQKYAELEPGLKDVLRTCLLGDTRVYQLPAVAQRLQELLGIASI